LDDNVDDDYDYDDGLLSQIDRWSYLILSLLSASALCRWQTTFIGASALCKWQGTFESEIASIQRAFFIALWNVSVSG